MNPILKMLLDAVVKYIQTHPDEMEKLVEYLIKMFLKWLEEHTPKP